MIVFLVFLGIALSEMASDIYVPALPGITEALNTSEVLVKLTLSINLIGMAISSLLYGILSDCYGRKKVFFSGIALFTIASMLCYFSTDIVYLLTMRFIQGFGAGVAGVVGHALLKDLYSGIKYSQIVAKAGMVISLSPAIGPIIGGFIISEFSWQFVFIILFIIGLILLIMTIFFFKETLSVEQREQFHLSKIFTAYNTLLTNKTFVVMCMIEGVMFIWLWNEIANLPFLLINIMGVEVSHYGYFVSMNVLSYVVGTMINHHYLPKVEENNILRAGIILCIIPDCILLIMRLFIELNPIIIVLVWIPSLIGLAFVISNSFAIALSSVPKKAIARASACMAFTQMAFGSLGIYIVSILSSVNSILPISITNILCSCIAFIIYTYVYKKKEKKQQI